MPAETFGQRLRVWPEALLHARTPDKPCWRLLPWVLLLAFAVRAAVAVAGSFTLHPDEVFQYLEPAHRLVFGNGVIHWEYFYGARSWLLPGLVAAILWGLALLGLDQPAVYTVAVELVFCAVSLLIPVGMYFFARRHFSEAAARVALLAGAFWYELVGFAHKPMTEFVATAGLLVLCALCLRPLERTRMVLLAAVVAVLVVSMRMQYAPLALFFLGTAFFCTPHRLRLALAAGAAFLAVGVFDGIAWDSSLFHSYRTNFELNLFLDPLREGESPATQYLLWLGLASIGLGALCTLAALFDLRRYGFLLAAIALVLVLHSLAAHKEYRFIFAVIPLWLLIGSDLAVRIMAHATRPRGPAAAMAGVFAAVSAAGILNALPDQAQVYRSYSNYHGTISFLRERDPLHDAYRYLAQAPGVEGVIHADRFYHELPGYYYLHRSIPFYDRTVLPVLGELRLADLLRSASHILSSEAELAIPGYRVDRTFGTVRIWHRELDRPPVRQWQEYAPNVSEPMHPWLLRVNPDSPAPPANFGIRFID